MTVPCCLLQRGKQSVLLCIFFLILVVSESHVYCPQGCACKPNSRHAQLNHVFCSNVNAAAIPLSSHTYSIDYISVFTSVLESAYFPNEPNHLIYLSWTHSGIENIQEDAFQNLGNLKFLNLSNNELISLNNAFRLLDNLLVVNLTGNKLKSLSYSDIPSFSLRHLYLGHNFLNNDCFLRGDYRDGICSESSFHRRNLTVLDLANNYISEFYGCPNCDSLTNLNVSKNEIESISNQIFVHIFSLKILDVSHNRVEKLSDSLLKTVILLEYLDVSDNYISDIPVAFLQNLQHLKYFNVSSNPITTIPTFIFKDCSSLNTLAIDNTNLSYVSEYFLYGLKQLLTFSFKNNSRLSTLPDVFLVFSTNIEYLDLRNNNLTIFPKSLSVLNKLKGVYLHGNPITCNCNIAWYIKWQKNLNFVQDYNKICSDWISSNDENCLDRPPLSHLIIEIRTDVVLNCGLADTASNVTWVSPDGQVYKLVRNYDAKQAFMNMSGTPTIIEDLSRIHVLTNGSLFIRRLLRGDCGLYVCRANDLLFNSTDYFVIQLDPITYNNIKLHSILAGFGSALGFLILTVSVQMTRKLCRRCGWCPPSNDDDESQGNQLYQVLESIEQYRTQQLEKLRENYTVQVDKIKENCLTQVEWICDSYQNQVKNLKDFRDYGTSHLSSIKEQYYEQVKRVKEYSNGQLTWVRENYVFQRNRIRKFSSHKVLRFRESYKYQQQTLNKVLENLPSLHLDNCRNGSCNKSDMAGAENIPDDFEVYVKCDNFTPLACHPEDGNESQSVYYTPSELSDYQMTPMREAHSSKLYLFPDLLKQEERILNRKTYSAIPSCNHRSHPLQSRTDCRSMDLSNTRYEFIPDRTLSMPEIQIDDKGDGRIDVHIREETKFDKKISPSKHTETRL